MWAISDRIVTRRRPLAPLPAVVPRLAPPVVPAQP
jgi:hypothetical protein